MQGAIVSTELGGVVSEIEFQNGGEAKKGDVLLKLDASAEEALLHSAEADLELARAEFATHARSCGAKSGFKGGTGCGGIEVRAETRHQSINMRSIITKKQVLAPFDGQLGIRQVNVGQMINPASKWCRSQPGSGLRRFRLAAARSCQVSAGLGGARAYGRACRAGYSKEK